MATVTRIKTGEYVYAGEGARIIDGTREVLRSLARKGHVRVLAIPGARPRYNRADLERLAAEGLRQTTAAGE